MKGKILQLKCTPPTPHYQAEVISRRGAKVKVRWLDTKIEEVVDREHFYRRVPKNLITLYPPLGTKVLLGPEDKKKAAAIEAYIQGLPDLQQDYAYAHMCCSVGILGFEDILVKIEGKLSPAEAQEVRRNLAERREYGQRG